MLVRASLISALLLSLITEAGAADHAQKSAADALSGDKTPQKGVARATTAEDLFATVAPKADGKQPLPGLGGGAPAPSQVIRSSRQKVDESGLRYFASQNNQKRVDKEIQRLKALYPDWTPPDDIFLGAPGGPEEQPLWDLFAKDKTAEMRALIAEKIKAEPKWKPSAALLYKLERKESRIRLVAAYEAKQWHKVIEVAASDPKIMTCADIDVPWRVSDAFMNVGQKAQTFEVFRFILSNCRDKKDRLTTLKKSLGTFEPREIDVLVAMGARNDDGTQEFDEIRIDLMRIRLGRLAAGKPTETPSAQDIAFFEANARRHQLSADASLSGWRNLSTKTFADAADWFRTAMEWPVQRRDDGTVAEEPVKMVEGRILALKGLEKFPEAEELAARWATQSDVIKALFLDILGDALLRAPAAETLQPERLSRYELIVASSQSAFGAQALGWYHFNRSAWDAAAPWFRSSLAWTAEGKADAKTAEGLAIALRNGFHLDEAEDLSYAWREKSPALRTLYLDVFAESLVRQSAPIAFPQERIDRYSDVVQADRSIIGAQGLAWYAHDRKNWPQAVRWFKTAIDWSEGGRGDEKLAEGYAQSLRNDGQFPQAEDVAYDWRDTSRNLRRLYVEISAEHLGKLPVAESMPKDRLNRFGGLVTTDKSSFGAGAIGWHLYDRKTFTESLRWFRQSLDYGPASDSLDKLREGFVLSLRYGGETLQAEDRAYDWRAGSPLLANVYVEIAADALTQLKPPAEMAPARLKRFIDTTTASKSSFGAQAIGWYRQQRGDNAGAAEWFSQSLAWGGKITDAKTAQGYLLALISLGRMDEADKLAFEWHEKSDEFRTLYIDVFGGAILRATPPQTFPEQMLARFGYIAAFDRSVFGSQAVAWYFYDRQDWPNAARWFQASLDWAGTDKHDQKTVEGFAQSIRYLARREEAEDILYAWRDRNPLLRKLYVEMMSEALVRTSAPIVFSDERLNRFGELVLADKDWFGAQGLAWYRHDRRQWPDAVRWFKYAREWSQDQKGDAKMAEGLAFSLRNLELYDESEFVSAEWKERSPIVRKLYSETVGEYLVRLKADVAYPNDRMERFLETVTHDSNNVGAQSAGWYYAERGLHDAAAQWFLASLQWGPDAERDPKTAEGYFTSLRLAGRIAEAEAAAFDWVDRSPAFRKVYLDLASEVVAGVKPPESFPAERLAKLTALATEFKSANAATGLAWYHQARDNWQDAGLWFERALDWGGDVQDVKAIEGYVIALVGLGRYDEAENLVFKWRERSDKIAGLYIDVFGGALLRLPADKQVPELRLARYQTLVGAERSVYGAQAIGWYNYDRRTWPESARWFQSSLDWAGTDNHDQKTVEGFAQSIRYLGRREEAEDILYPWRDKNPTLRKLYVELFAEALVNTSSPVFFSDERLNRYGDLVLADKDWFGAQGLAWYRHDRRQWPDAVRWFKYAREWSKDGKGDAKMAEGLAFSLRNLDLYDESEFVSAEWKDRSPAMRKLYSETVGEYLVRMKPEATYPNDRMERFLATTSLDHNNIGAQSAGWYYYARDMFEPAAEWFLASLQWGPDLDRDPKTAEGYVTSLRRGGRLVEAELAAFDLRDRSPALRDLYFDIAGEVIAAMKPPQSFPEERLARFVELTEESRSVSGALAVAWYHQAREDWREATGWFERAMTWGGAASDDPKVAEGYLVALVGLGRFDEAENLVHSWRAHNPAMSALYLDVFGGSLLRLVSTQTVPHERLDRYGVVVGLEKSAFGAQALAWYHHDRRNWDDASRWFQASLGWTKSGRHDVKSIEGFAQALRFTGRREEAEELLFQWRGVNPGMLKLYVETFAEALINQNAPIDFADFRIDRFAQVALDERSSLGAQALAWYRYNRKVWGDAARWFKNARAWSADGKGDAKLAEGLAFSLRNMDLYDESESVSWEWRDKSPAVRKLYAETVAEFLVRLKPRETYPVDRLSRYQAVITADKSSIGAQAAGWYYFARDRFPDAATWFRNALDWGPDHIRDPKTAEGLAIALRNGGRIDEAETFAYSWRDRSPRFAELYLELAADAMGRVTPPATYPAERMARLVNVARFGRNPFAAQAIGWYKTGRKEWSDAAEWFKSSLDWTGDEKDGKTIEGYAFALRNLGRIDEAETLALAWKDKSEALAGLYLDAVIEQINKAKPPAAYPADRLATFAEMVTARRHIGGAQSLGWYKLDRQENADGETWFRNAIAWGGDAKDVRSLEGYAVSQKRQFKYDEAEALAFDWRDKSEPMRELYRLTMMERMLKTKPPASIPPDRLKRFTDYASGLRQPAAAMGVGWYHYDRKDWTAAMQWFRNAIDWEPDTKNAKGAEGYVLALKNAGKIEEAEAFAYEWRDRAPEMRNLYIDLVPELLAKVATGAAFPADRLNRFSAQVTAAKSAYGAQAIGWYRLQRNDHAQAATWFKSALDWSGDAKDPKMAEGYVLALRATGRLDDAEAVSFEWRDRADPMRALYIDAFAEALTKNNPPPAFAPERLARYAAVVSADKNAIGAQALGWYSYNIKQVRPARAWFEKAMQWAPSEGSALGLAFSARAMKDNAGFLSIIQTHRTAYPKLGELLAPQAAAPQAAPQIYATTGAPQPQAQPQVRYIETYQTVTVPARPAARAPARSAPAESAAPASGGSNAACIANIEAKERNGSAGANDFVAKGWCLLNANRPQEAAQAFARGGRGSQSGDAAYGQALSHLRSGATDEAAAAAERAPLTTKRRNDVGLQVLQQRATAAQRAGRYVEALHYMDQRAAFAPETRDIAMQRGWAQYNLGRKDAARRIFTELDRQLSTNETQSALATVNEIRGQ